MIELDVVVMRALLLCLPWLLLALTLMPPPPVTEVSDSESDEKPAPKRGLKRKARFQFDDPLQLELMLSKPCSAQGCTKRCKDHFRSAANFSSLLAFRKKWKAYHKLDRDQMATYLLM